MSDEGAGIAPERLPRLFSWFCHADLIGAGELGLYISWVLVEAHSGRIWAESTPDRGSIFTVVLPLV